MLKKLVENYIAPPSEELRNQWIISKLLGLPKGKTLLDVGAGEMPYKMYCSHLKYTSQDFGAYTGENVEVGIQTGKFDAHKVDIISDITHIPTNKTFDYILCTEVFEHIPNPFLALKEIQRLQKKGGKLILTAPFASLTHFYPYHFFSGFSENFYLVNLPKYGYKVNELHVYGNYFDWLGQEFLRVPLIVFPYSKIAFLLTLPFMFLAIPWFVLIRILGYLFPQTKKILSFGICTISTKVS